MELSHCYPQENIPEHNRSTVKKYTNFLVLIFPLLTSFQCADYCLLGIFPWSHFKTSALRAANMSCLFSATLCAYEGLKINLFKLINLACV